MPKRKAPTLAKLKAKAWDYLSLCVRQEAADQAGGVDCYTCDGWAHWKAMQAGHAIGGRTGSVLLDEEVIRPQCARCNIWLRGNYQEFIPRLIRERERINPYGIGLDWWEGKLQSSRQVRKWDRAELLEKIESYKARLEALSQ